MELSIVTTMYHSAPYIEEFYERVSKAAQKITDDFEIIFVNDGSPDNSLDIAVSLHEKDSRVTVVDLSRNFGHHRAMMTGLGYARGEKVFLIDCDLEEAPELLSTFYEKFNKDGCDVVYGVQETRKGGAFERISGNIFYTLFNRLSGIRMPHNPVTSRLMSGRYVKSLLLYRERELFIDGIWHITGYKQIAVYVNKHSTSTSTYSLRKKIAQSVNAITSFSDTPLIFIFYTGIMISSISALYILYLFIRKMFSGITISGWTSLVVSVWFLGGLTIFFIGIIGIYLSKIFIETKQRPYSIIRAVYGRDKDEKDI